MADIANKYAQTALTNTMQIGALQIVLAVLT
jgi:hypothetical protein